MKKILGVLGLLILLSLVVQPPVAQASLVPTGDLTFFVPLQDSVSSSGSLRVDSLKAGTTDYTVSGGLLTYSTTLNTISLTGAVPVAGINDPKTVLFSGILTSSSEMTLAGVNFLFAQLAISQNPVLSQFFLGSVPHQFAGALVVLHTNEGFFGSAGTKPIASPVPSAALLLGAGLMSIGIVRKRIRKQK